MEPGTEEPELVSLYNGSCSGLARQLQDSRMPLAFRVLAQAWSDCHKTPNMANRIFPVAIALGIAALTALRRFVGRL